MYDLLKINRIDEYFLPASKRNKNGVYFCRFIGYDAETLVFFRQLQVAAQSCGAYIRGKMKNPAEAEVSQLSATIDLNAFRLDKPYVDGVVGRWFGNLPPAKRQPLADSLLETLQTLSRQGMGDSILRNMFAKWLCWCHSQFASALKGCGRETVPKILYEGDISKHEVYLLRVLSRAGCDIAYIHYESESGYRAVDKQGVFSQMISGKQQGEPTPHFSQIDLAQREQAEKLKTAAASAAQKLNTNAWSNGSFQDEIVKSNSARGALGGCIYNLFIRYLGVDEKDTYLAGIFKLREALSQCPKPLVMVEDRFANPTLDEVRAIRPITYANLEEMGFKLAAAIDLPGNKELEGLIRAAFAKAATGMDGPLAKAYNSSMKLLCWLRRYLLPLFESAQPEQIPVFLYYGVCNESVAEFCNLLASMPVDVLVISPDKTAADAFRVLGSRDRGRNEELAHSMPLFPFPQTAPKVRATTAAYEASRELDTLLYTGSGLFRERQFTRCNPVTLKTTYDEVEILWKEEAKFRPNFEAAGGMVTVPNIFARICGVKDGAADAYFQSIARLYTDRTIYIREFPYITSATPAPIRSSVHKFWNNGTILPDQIKRHKDYAYDYLSEDTQDYILEKIQQLIDLEWVKSDTQGVEYAVLATLLSLDQTVLRLIQQFDFTKEIPKVIVAHMDEKMPSLEDCIFLAFLNLAGFDIVVFTPTGYRDLDKYLQRTSYEEYQIGDYLFQLRPPDITRLARSQGTGLFGRLFGKG